MQKYCKECAELKFLEEFYKHPQGVMGTLPRCKECIKKGRRSEKERKMARVNDKKRSNNIDRIKYITENTRKYRELNPLKRDCHKKVNNYFRKNQDKKPNICHNCGSYGKIEMHHEDYNKPFSIIPLCPLCHKGYHSGKIQLNKNKEIILKYS